MRRLTLVGERLESASGVAASCDRRPHAQIALDSLCYSQKSTRNKYIAKSVGISDKVGQAVNRSVIMALECTWPCSFRRLLLAYLVHHSPSVHARSWLTKLVVCHSNKLIFAISRRGCGQVSHDVTKQGNRTIPVPHKGHNQEIQVRA